MLAAGGLVLRFSKMHGAGNDFVIVDRRDGRAWPDAQHLQQWADRRLGVGCDQIISIEPEREGMPGYAIRNSDASVAEQCGNGARCVAAWLWRDGVVEANDFVMHSPAGPVAVRRDDRGQFAVQLSVPDFDPVAVGLIDHQTPMVIHAAGRDLAFSACSMGNPHALIEVDDLDAVDVPAIGRALQSSARFADGVNVGVAQVLSPHHIRLTVFERGAGLTLACGSGACAAAALLIHAGRAQSPVRIDMPGGTLQVDWPGLGHPVWLAGPATFVFEGELCA